MSEIRVTYSGLIGLFASLISIIAGLIFSLIITRSLSPDQYGAWSLIGSMVAYFIISEGIISNWTIRQVARGEDVGKTAVVTSLIFSIITIPLYILYVNAISSQNSVDVNLMMQGWILLPVFFLSQTLAAINRAHKPHTQSFGILTFETLKIPGVLFLVFIFDLGVTGVIISVTLAHLAKIFVQLYFAKPKLIGKFRKKTIKRWFKLSWIPIYLTLHRFAVSLDIVLYTVITGSVVGLAFYHASLIIAGIIGSSSMVSHALLPKLLSGGSHKHVGEIFRLSLFFGIPLLTIAILFAKPTLFALNPVYQDASLIVIFLAFKSFLAVIIGILYNVLSGLEKVDVEENPSFRELLKSKLFSNPTIALVHSLGYIISFVIVTTILQSMLTPEFDLVIWWVIIALLSHIPLLIYLWNQVRKNVTLLFPYVPVLKYTIGGFSMFIVYSLTSDYIIQYKISIYEFLPGLLIEGIICIVAYLGITYILDQNTRNLSKSIVNEMFNRS